MTSVETTRRADQPNSSVKTGSLETPGDKVLNVIQLKLQTSRDRVERSILKDILLRAGISEISNKTNKGYFIKK